MWIRGCIERGDYYSSAKSSCAGAHGRTAEIGRLLKTESFAHMGGAVCLCDETDCNGQTRGELSNMANGKNTANTRRSDVGLMLGQRRLMLSQGRRRLPIIKPT